jgi:peroxiredoxin
MLRRAKDAKRGERPSPKAVLGPGTPALDLALRDQAGQLVSLRDFRGRPVVLVFYPADWSPVPGTGRE